MLKLLMVDDEKWVRDRFSERIPWSDAGFVFLGAASGADEAIRMIEKETPHLLLTDITMPNMNGLELAGYVRKRWPRIRVVILTAYSEFEYARQAIELGVNHYLIKLAQTPDIILDVCRKIAAEIMQEIDVDQKLEMNLSLENEKEWNRKRLWTEHALYSSSADMGAEFLREWPSILEHANFYSCLTVGWNVPVAVNGQGSPTEEELVRIQRHAAESLERRMDAEMSGSDYRRMFLPIGINRLFLFMASKNPITNRHTNPFATMALEALSEIAPERRFIYVGSTREASKQPARGRAIVDGMKEGLDGLAWHFYKPENALVTKSPTALRRIDAEEARELVASFVKALQRENMEALLESIASLLNPGDSLIHPADLLRLTKQLLNPELVQLPVAVVARLDEIGRLECWADYAKWWSEIRDAIEAAFSKRLNPPATVRKEIQLMCRYIQKHYMEDVQASELAKIVQLHPSYAGQMFKQEIGENFSDYVNRVRMEKASELLEQTTMKIYEVSSAVGISDYRYFCKMFKGYTGITPTQYKNKQG